MSGIYLGETVRLKTYTSVTKGQKATIRIELETPDRYDLSYLLRQLDALYQEQQDRAKPAKKARQAPEEPAQLALAAPLRQIPDMREDRS